MIEHLQKITNETPTSRKERAEGLYERPVREPEGIYENAPYYVPHDALDYVPHSVAQRVKGLGPGQFITLSVSFGFLFVGEIEKVVDENTYTIMPVGIYADEEKAKFQEKVGVSMEPSFQIAERQVYPADKEVVKRKLAEPSPLRLKPEPPVISQSVMNNGLLVSSESAGKGISGMDAEQAPKLSVNVFKPEMLSVAGREEEAEEETEEAQAVENNINTLFYKAAGGVFPISIERKDIPVIEFSAESIIQEKIAARGQKILLPEICEFIEKKLAEQKPMFEYYAARNMLIVGAYPHATDTFGHAHEERSDRGIGPECFEYVFYAEGFGSLVDKDVRPGLSYIEVKERVDKEIQIPVHYYFHTTDESIIQRFSQIKAISFRISVPDYEGSLLGEQLQPGQIYFSHVVRL